MISLKTASFRLMAAVVLVTAVACVDLPTDPTPSHGVRAARDTVPGDTTTCRGGFTVVLGKVVCDET